MSEVWIAGVAAAVVGAGATVYEGAQNREAANKALDATEAATQAATYTPINIPQLQQQATEASIANATASLQLQKNLQPGVYAANQEAQNTVAKQLAAGGQLTPDEVSQVAQAARVAGGSSGAVGGTGPYTAALIGQSANSLLQQRLGNAEAVSAANPAPAVGLSASDLASATIAGNNAQNQFTLSKLGANQNLINSTAQLTTANNAATLGGINSALTGAGALVKAFNTPSVTTGTPAAQQGTATDGTDAAVSMGLGSIVNGQYVSGAGTGAPAGGDYGGFGCWVAREAFGENDPRWRQFRFWMVTRAPVWFALFYLRHGPWIARVLHWTPFLKPAVRSWMKSRIATLPEAVLDSRIWVGREQPGW